MSAKVDLLVQEQMDEASRAMSVEVNRIYFSRIMDPDTFEPMPYWTRNGWRIRCALMAPFVWLHDLLCLWLGCDHDREDW